MSQSFHKCYTICQDICSLTCFDDISHVFVKFLEMLSQIFVFLFLWHVHKEIKNSLFTMWEWLLKISLNWCSDSMWFAKVVGVPICIWLTIYKSLFTLTSILQELIEEFYRQNLNIIKVLKVWNIQMVTCSNI